MGKIGKSAGKILEGVEKGEHYLYISTISLVEIMYFSQKNRIPIYLEDTLEVIDRAMNYSIVDLKYQIVRLAENINFPEIFDRLIISTAKYLEIPILTSDKKITSSKFVETIW